MNRMLASISIGGAASATMLMFGSPLTAAAQPAAQLRRCEDSPWLDVNFEANRHIRIPVIVNGVHTMGLLDSGASRTVIDAAFARRIGLQTTSGYRAHGVTDAISGKIARAVSISAGKLELPPLDAAVMDLGDLARVARQPVDVIIGHELFLQGIVDLDLPNGRLRITPGGCGAEEMGGVSLPLIRLDSSYAIKVSLEGRPPAPLALDLGSNVALYFSRDYAERVSLLDGRRISSAASMGAEGVDIAQAVTVRDIEIAGIFLTRVPALIPARWKLPAVGVVGLPVLRRFRLQVDFARKKVKMVADETAAARSFARDRSGLNAIARDDHLQVLHVAENSPADRAGLKVGDRISLLNGQAVPSALRSHASPISHQPEGTKVHLTRADGKTFTLTLADYF